MRLDLIGVLPFTHSFASWIPTPEGLIPGLWPLADFMTSIELLGFLGMGLGTEKEGQLGK